jgi:hypothetical protein
VIYADPSPFLFELMKPGSRQEHSLFETNAEGVCSTLVGRGDDSGKRLGSRGSPGYVAFERYPEANEEAFLSGNLGPLFSERSLLFATQH